MTYAGPWFPEPVVLDHTSAVEQADSLSLAFLVLLEELTPLERAAYLFHDIFGYPFEEVARSQGRSEPACRQLAARARQRIECGVSASTPISSMARRSPIASSQPCATGDLAGLLAMLSDDVIVWTDGGGKVRAAVRPVAGPTAPRGSW